MSAFEDENAKSIIGNLLIAPESDSSIMQQHEVDSVTREEFTRDRNRKQTEKGQEFWVEVLRGHRDTASRRISRRIQKICSTLENIKDIEVLTQQIEDLDLLKEDLSEAFNEFHQHVEGEEDRAASYQWFDLRDRDYNECRMKISSRIHAIERRSIKASSVKSSSQSSSRSTRLSHLSSSSARSRKIKAAARAAKLEAQIGFLDKEAELKKVTMMKELAMAKAERDAMKALENEDHCETSVEDPNPSCQVQGSLNQDAPPILPKDTFTPLSLHKPSLSLRSNLQEATPLNPFSALPAGSFCPPVKSEHKENDASNPFTPATLGKPPLPVKRETQGTSVTNPSASSTVEPQVKIADLNSGQVVLREMIKLQARQTELSFLIAEQQKISSLPVQEPPMFNGNFFDYPSFIRAFETIIEARVSDDKGRLYFLNKYTSGKANDIIKGFVTLNSSNSYQRAKKLLAQRFGDPHRVSDAYETRLRKWPQIGDGHSSDLLALSDFLIQCEEAMKSVNFMSDLDSSEFLKLVSSKLPSYSGVKWCRHAFEVKKNYGRTVTFRDIMKFVETEADLATDPVFSPDALKEERKKGPDKTKIFTHRRRPPNANSFTTSTTYSQRNNSPASEPKSSSRMCPVCSKARTLTCT